MLAPPFRAPHHGASAAAIVGGGAVRDRGRRASRIAGAAPRRAAGVLAILARVAPSAARGRRRLGRPRRRARALSGSLPARRDDEPLPVRRARRSRRPTAVQPAAIAAYRRRFARAARSLRPGRRDAKARAEELAAPPGEASAAVRRGSWLRANGRVRREPRRTGLPRVARPCCRRIPLSGRGRARVARVARTVAALAGAELCYRARRRGALVLSSELPGDMSYRRSGGDARYPPLLARDPRSARTALRSEVSPPDLLARPASQSSARGPARPTALGRPDARPGARRRPGSSSSAAWPGHRRRSTSRRARRGGSTVAVLGCGIDATTRRHSASSPAG